jgi:hypothetical protein
MIHDRTSIERRPKSSNMDLPEPAIRWLALHASSNAELACISNVCRKWRKNLKKVLLEIASDSLVTLDDNETPSLLLLPSMVRYVMSKEMNTNNHIETYCLAWFNPAGIKFKQVPIDPESDSDEGHQTMTVKHRAVESPQSFAPGGEQLYAGSEDEKKKNSRRQPMRSTTISARLRHGEGDKFENCLYQWDGCRTPEDVLLPFGYASAFIQVSTT